MSIALASVAEVGDSDTDSAAAFAAFLAEAAGLAGAQPEAPLASVAEAGDSDTDSAAAFAAFLAEAARLAGAQPEAPLASVAEAGNSDTDSAAAFAAFLAEAAGLAGVPVMMIPGSIDEKNNWVEPTSLARAVEDAMVSAGVLNVSKESKVTTKDRRKGFIAVATGLIGYLQQNMDIQIKKAQLHDANSVSLEVPTADTTLTQAAN